MFKNRIDPPLHYFFFGCSKLPSPATNIVSFLLKTEFSCISLSDVVGWYLTWTLGRVGYQQKIKRISDIEV